MEGRWFGECEATIGFDQMKLCRFDQALKMKKKIVNFPAS